MIEKLEDKGEGIFYSTSIEKTVLGMCIMDNSFIPFVEKGDFYWETSRVILTAMEELFKDGKEIDLVILTDKLGTKELVDPLYVTSLLDGVPKVKKESFQGLIDTLSEYKRVRDLDVLSLGMQSAIQKKDSQGILDIANKIKERSVGGGIGGHALTADTLVNDFNDYRHSGGGVKLGIPSLDDASNGIAPGEICYLLARAKVIKSIMTQNVLRHFSSHYPSDGAIFFSLEMNSPQLGERLLRIESGKHVESITEEENKEIIDRHKNIFYITKAALSLRDIYSEIIQLQSKSNIRLVIIDFLTRIRTHIAGEYEFLREATKFLKDMAKELGVSLLVLAQVGRETGRNGDVPLSLRSGRGSGTIEEDADFVLGAYRPELNSFLTPDERFIVEGIVCLQTLGARRLPYMNDIFLRFDKRTLRVHEIQRYINKKEFYEITHKIKRYGKAKNEK